MALVQLRMRHARSLKDKRHIVQALMQKLRNSGFSVTEVAHQDDPKRAHLGVAFAARDGQAVEHAMKELDRFLIGEFEVLGCFRDQIDFEPKFNMDQPFYVGPANPELEGIDDED